MDTQVEQNGQTNGKAKASEPENSKPKQTRTRKTANQKLEALLTTKQKEVTRLEAKLAKLDEQTEETQLALGAAQADLAKYKTAAGVEDESDNDDE